MDYSNDTLIRTFFLQGVVCGITTLLLSCFGGGLTSGRVQAILLMSISVGCCNAINMIVMEVSEWHVFDGHHGHGHGHHHPQQQHGSAAGHDAAGQHHGYAAEQNSTAHYGSNGSYYATAGYYKDSRKDTMSFPAMEPDPFTAEVIKSLLSYGGF
jgi:hypothetical protein